MRVAVKEEERWAFAACEGEDFYDGRIRSADCEAIEVVGEELGGCEGELGFVPGLAWRWLDFA